MLGHVADKLADLDAVARDIEVEDGRRAGCRLEQPEEDLEQGRLPGSVRAHETDDPGLDLERQPVERGDARAVALRQGVRRDEAHRFKGSVATSPRDGDGTSAS